MPVFPGSAYLADYIAGSSSSDATVTASVVVAVGSVPAPTVSASSAVSSGAVPGVGSVPSPTPHAGSRAVPAAVAGVGGVLVPTSITGSSSATVTPDAVSAAADVPSPGLLIYAPLVVAPGATVPSPAFHPGPSFVAAVADVPAPAPSSGVTIAAPVVPAIAFLSNPMSSWDAEISVHGPLLAPVFAGDFEDTDEGFDTTGAGWGDPTRTTDDSHSGTHSLSITRTSNTPGFGYSLCLEEWTVEVGTDYEVSAWFKANNNGKYNLDVTEGASSFTRVAAGTVTAINGQWVQLVYSFNSGANTTVGLVVTDDESPAPLTGDQFYIDDIMLSPWGPYTMGVASIPDPDVRGDNVVVKPAAVQAVAAVPHAVPAVIVYPREPILLFDFESASVEGFTTGSANWSTPVLSTDTAVSGTHSLLIERISSTPGDGYTLNDDVLSVSASTDYLLTGQISSNYSGTQIKVEVMDSAGTTALATTYVLGFDNDIDVWVEFALPFNSGAETGVRLRISDDDYIDGLSGDLIHIDDLQVSERSAVRARAAVPIPHITADNAWVAAPVVPGSAAVPLAGATTPVEPATVAAVAAVPFADNGAPPAPVTDLTATVIDPWTIQLDWTNPADPDFAYIYVMRSEGLPLPDPTINPINDVYLFVVVPAGSPSGTWTYTDTTARPGTTYYYNVFTYDMFDHVDLLGGVDVTATTEALTEVDALVFGFSMFAGTVDLQPGTPVPPPGAGIDIEVTGPPITFTLTMVEGVYWNKTLSTPPPTRPNDPPPNYTGPGSGPAYQWDFNDPLIPPRTPTDIRVEIWDSTNTTLIQALDYSASRQFLDEYNGVGSGSLRIPKPHIDAALLQRDRVIRFYYRDIPDAVFASVIQGRSTQVIGTPGDEWVTVNGPGTLSWLEDAVVLPFKQLGDRYPKKTIIKADGANTVDATQDSELQINAPDIRAFNFASRDFFRPAHRYRLFDAVGPGTNADLLPGYHQPLGYPQGRTLAEGNFRAGFPANWPDPQAEWIWGSNPLAYHPESSDGQLCWFVAHVYLVITGRYRWFCSGDDGFILWFDGVELASSSYNEDYEEGWRKTTEIDLNLTRGWHVIAMRGENRPLSVPPVIDEYGNPVPQPALPDANVGAVIGTLMHLDENGKPVLPVPNCRTQRVSQTAFTGWLSNWANPAWSAGDVLYTLVEEAQARGITRLQNVTMDFDRDIDSHGAPWTTRVSRTWDVGTSVLQVAFDLCELGVDVWMTPDNVLHCAERRGSDAPSFSVLYGQNVLGYSTEETFSGASVAYTKTRTGWMMLENETAAAILGGKRETAISVVNTDSEDSAIGISKRAIGAIVMANIVATADAIIPRDADPAAVPAVQGSIPYTDVNISDIIYVLSPNGQRRMGRLLSVTVNEDEAGNTVWIPEIEIWSSPFGDGVDPNVPLDPIDPNNPFDSSTWVPAVEDWARFVPINASVGGAGDYPRRVTVPPIDAPGTGAKKSGAAKTPNSTTAATEGGGYGGDPVSYAGNTPEPRSSSYSTPVDPDYYNHAAKPNYERIFIGPDAPLITAGYHLWVDTSGLEA